MVKIQAQSTGATAGPLTAEKRLATATPKDGALTPRAVGLAHFAKRQGPGRPAMGPMAPETAPSGALNHPSDRPQGS
jgi:hypothetical protein